MGATDAVHPTEQTLQAYGLGKLDDASAESVEQAPGVVPVLPEPRGRDDFRQLPRPAARRSRVARFSAAGRLARWLARCDAGPAVHRRRRAHYRRAWPTTPITRSSASSARAAWASFTWPRTSSWAGRRCSRSSAATSSNRRGVLDRFLGEIRNAARLHHPNIVTAYSALRLGESIVFAMEYVEGLDLAKLVKAQGPLPVANACYYIHQAALGLQHAHEQGMVHRDIKPSNLMLARQGNRAVVKVLDFGLAKVSQRGGRPTAD